MKYTNALNLPEPLVKAIINDLYSKGESDYSVTELLTPPRVVALIRKHQNEIEVDVADEIYRLCGQLIHSLLERAGVPERRWSITVLGKTVSGKMDRFKDGVLDDWKFTTAWKFKDGTAPIEVEQQLNCYAEILRQNGHTVTELRAIGILRDFSKLEVFRNESYPRKQTVIVPVKLWTPAEAKLFLNNRVVLHEKAKQELPLCSKEERWAKDDEWAVTKKGNKRATKLLSTPELAEEFKSEQKKPLEYEIKKREGESTRCKAYCKAAAFCEQWKKIKDDKSSKE